MNNPVTINLTKTQALELRVWLKETVLQNRSIIGYMDEPILALVAELDRISDESDATP